MAKKNVPKPHARPSKSAAMPTKKQTISDKWMPWVPLVLGVLVFSTGLTNELLGIDDHTATVDNPAVRDFKLFSSFNLGMYAPLTWAVYGVAYTLGKDNPFWYHLFSLAVHAFNIWLVFRLLTRLSMGAKTSLAVTLLFAIHPVQVESVAWIAGFSTPLFSMFFLLSCLKYLDYAERPAEAKPYYLSLLLFVAACLSKSAAVTLPLVLVVLDLWRKPAMPRARQMLGYLPFFLIALIFGLLTIYSRTQSAIATETPGSELTLLERLQVLCYTPVFYWFNTLAPFELNIYYSFDKVNGHLPWPYLIAPFVVIVSFIAAWRYREKASWLWFGLLFFFANVSVMLPFVSHGTFEFIADHYNYLAMIGTSLILVKGWQALRERWPSLSGGLRWIGLAWLGLIVILCLRQISVWKDTNTVVSNAIENGYYQNGLMYAARAKHFGNKGKIKEAIRDFDKSLEINPNLYESYKFRGGLYGMMKQYEKSVADLSKYLEHYPNDAEQYYNRGLSLLNLGRLNDAVADFSRTLELNPNFARAYRARGNAYKSLGEAAKAESDLTEWERRNSTGGN
ncbi:MAG: tetratricopeptide repeat protein [Saprospiraceae bacterium]|nr:tetratricopeptide repeat protein [Saprospiraceae bacterium]